MCFNNIVACCGILVRKEGEPLPLEESEKVDIKLIIPETMNGATFNDTDLCFS